MGACGSKNGTIQKDPSDLPGGTLGVMFKRFDKEGKGYISRRNLQSMMKDDKTYFQGNDVDHILEKYGSDSKMTFEQFQNWWNSTYTTYNDDIVGKLVDQVNQDGLLGETGSGPILNTIPELEDAPPENSNVAVSRS